jgi:hypothetical protein
LKKTNKTKGHPDDVSIGNDEWIRFVDITGRTEQAANLDALIRPMEAFWRSLEVNCVSECCGINAHSFWPQDIWNAARSSRDPDLRQKLAGLRQHVEGLSVDCVRSEVLNQHFDRAMFARLLDHVIKTVEQM